MSLAKPVQLALDLIKGSGGLAHLRRLRKAREALPGGAFPRTDPADFITPEQIEMWLKPVAAAKKRTPAVADENLLMAQHNLSAESLEHADRLGGLAAPSVAITRPGLEGRGALEGFGPRLTQKQWDDLHKSAKKRSNWKDARRAWYKKTKSDIEELRSQRKQPNRDPLGGVPTGAERIKRKLQKQRYERGASELLDKYGLGGDSHSKYIVSSRERTQPDLAGLEEALDKRKRLLERLESVRGVSGNNLWNKTNAAEVNVGLNYLLKHGDSVRDVPAKLHGAITRANLEAVPRALKKEGWTVRHASTHRGSGRRSSRYLVSPDDGYEIRLTDHYLPETWARQMQHKYMGAGRWDDELVIDEHDVSPLEIIETIKKLYKEHKEDAVYRTQMFTVPPAAGAGALGALLGEDNGI